MDERHAASWIKVPGWERYLWLLHGFSTRRLGGTTAYARGGPGELNLGHTPQDDATIVEENRRLAAESIGGPGTLLATVRQVHGTVILEAAAGGRAGEADGLVTGQAGLLLGVMAADCVPILVADVRQHNVGAFHAGWRGTAAGMAAAGVARMLEMGARSEDLIAAVGPSIGPCCYQVGDEVRGAFAGRADGVLVGGSLDLWETNRRQLMQAGVSPDRISVVGECTSCSRTEEGGRKYFSHRAEHGVTGRMMGMVGVSPD